MYLFYCWLHWVFLAVYSLSLVPEPLSSCGARASCCAGFSFCGAQALGLAGFSSCAQA